MTETAEKLRFLLAQSGHSAAKGQQAPINKVAEPEDEPIESNLADTNSIRSLAEGLDSSENPVKLAEDEEAEADV